MEYLQLAQRRQRKLKEFAKTYGRSKHLFSFFDASFENEETDNEMFIREGIATNPQDVKPRTDPITILAYIHE